MTNVVPFRLSHAFSSADRTSVKAFLSLGNKEEKTCSEIPPNEIPPIAQVIALTQGSENGG